MCNVKLIKTAKYKVFFFKFTHHSFTAPVRWRVTIGKCVNVQLNILIIYMDGLRVQKVTNSNHPSGDIRGD